MVTEIIKLEHVETKTSYVFGGTTTIVEYHLKTSCNGVKNEYEVFGEIRGIQTADLHLILNDYKPLSNNEETLTKEAIEELLNW